MEVPAAKLALRLGKGERGLPCSFLLHPGIDTPSPSPLSCSKALGMGVENGSHGPRLCSSRENVLRNLADKVFDKPICEALLDQRFFNGIGNYLRAEILYRSAGKPRGLGRAGCTHIPYCLAWLPLHPTSD